MRLIKMLGLAAVAAMAAMAFVGATSASANGNTQLCTTHPPQSLNCQGNGANSVAMVNQGSGELLTTLVDVICDTIAASATPLEIFNPQQIHVTHLLFNSCETPEDDGCTVTVLELPLFNLLKTGLDSGTLTGTNGQTLVECEDVFFGLDIHCVYDGTGLAFSVGAQHLTASKTKIEPVGGALCPEESFLDGLLVTTANRYVLWLFT